MRISSPGPRCRNRALEWFTNGILLSFAFIMLVTPLSLEKGAFRYVIDIGISASVFKWSCLVFGLTTCLALYYNGRGLPWTARIRAVCAVFRAIVFGHLSLSLAYLTKDTGTISLGVGTHALLACAEIYSCLRAGADVNYPSFCPYVSEAYTGGRSDDAE